MVQQQRVEGRARHLPRLGMRHFTRHGEVGEALDAAVGRHEGRAPLAGKGRGLHRRVGPDRRHHLVDGGEQRLADVESGEGVALEQDDAAPGPGQRRGGRRSGRSAAHDDHVAIEAHAARRIVCKGSDRIPVAAMFTSMASGWDCRSRAPRWPAPSSLPALPAQTPTAGDRPTLRVPRVEDFAISGQGDHATWARLEWVALNGRQGVTGAPATRIKVAYSATGLYVLMDAADQKLTATYQEDFSDLWKEDVFEVFLWPDERDTIYFEYEVSPLGRELPILIPNFDDRFLGLASLALRRRSACPPSHLDRRRPDAVGSGDQGLAGRADDPLLAPHPAAERPSVTRREMARQLLPGRSRWSDAGAMGLVARRAELPRVPEFRDPRLRVDQRVLESASTTL